MTRTEILMMIYSNAALDTAEKRFAAMYVTAQEVQEALKVSRVAVLQKLNKFESVTVGGVRVWERSMPLETFIWDWTMRRIRNGDLEPTDKQLIRMAEERAGVKNAK